jgi:cytochrome c5
MAACDGAVNRLCEETVLRGVIATTRAWYLTLPLAAAAVVYAATAGAQEPRSGEQIMNASCSGSCHDARPIQTSAKDEPGWAKTIDDMIQRGAMVSDADRPVLLTYLVRSHGPMPDGRGKDIVLNTCTICHDLTRIKRSRHTPEEWDDILSAMLNEGAPLSDDDFPVVLSYLARNFGLN